MLLEDLEDTFNKLDLTIADLPAALASTVHRENIGELGKSVFHNFDVDLTEYPSVGVLQSGS